VAIGAGAGYESQDLNCVAVGNNAGHRTQKLQTVGVGASAGFQNQGQAAVAIGYESGCLNQGEYAVAIGFQAGFESQTNNSIVLNASGYELNTATSGLFVKPVRTVTTPSTGVLFSDASTSEIAQTSNVQLNTVGASGQIRSMGPTGFRIAVTYSGPSINLDLRKGSYALIEGGGDSVITCSNFEFGDHLYVQLTGGGTATFSYSFATSNNPGYMAKDNSLIHFICDAYHMLEVSRSSWAYTHDPPP
jgi:hypothetical protein